MAKKVLVVDDEPQFVDMVKMRLEANGYEVISASNGNEGLKSAKQHRPDVILLDIIMPEKDGYTMLRELRGDEQIRHIPVIVVTVKPSMKDLFEIEGVRDYIVKPFETEELLLRVKKALRE